MSDEFFRVSVWSNDNCYFISKRAERLYVNGLTIVLPHHIKCVAIGKDMILVTTEKHEENGELSVEQPKNNIYAYDFAGKYLGDLEDIMGKGFMKYYQTYSEVSYHTAETLLKHVKPADFNADQFKKTVLSNPDHEYIACSTVWANRYVFDITGKCMIDYIQNY